MPHAPSNPRTIIVGGGLAGIAAAVRLAAAGSPVTLLEARNRLGGRATSFVDPQSGQVLDNCQHVLMGCCTNLIDLYERLGVADRIAWHDRFYFLDRAGRLDVLRSDPLPAPLHLGRSLMLFRGLSMRSKLAISRAMTAMMRLPRERRHEWHDRSFAEWLDEHDQPAEAVEKYWSNIIVSALNEQVDHAAADYALQVFQDGFLANRRASLMGLARVPLVQLYDAAQQVIERAGGEVRFNAAAKALAFDGERITHVVLGDDRELPADTVISALPFDRLAKVCPPPLIAADDRLQRLDDFRFSPIIGIHLWMQPHGQGAAHNGREVMSLPHVALTQSPLHWVFNKGHDAGHDAQHLHGVISAAYALIDQPAEAIIDLAVAEVRHLLPAARDARLVHARVIKEKRATYSAHPGVDALRPPARGAVANLYLAGDWCRTGWPATMEGAVRSGHLAAAAALQDAGAQAGLALVSDLPTARLYRLMSR